MFKNIFVIGIVIVSALSAIINFANAFKLDQRMKTIESSGKVIVLKPEVECISYTDSQLANGDSVVFVDAGIHQDYYQLNWKNGKTTKLGSLGCQVKDAASDFALQQRYYNYLVKNNIVPSAAIQASVTPQAQTVKVGTTK